LYSIILRAYIQIFLINKQWTPTAK